MVSDDKEWFINEASRSMGIPKEEMIKIQKKVEGLFLACDSGLFGMVDGYTVEGIEQQNIAAAIGSCAVNEACDLVAAAITLFITSLALIKIDSSKNPTVKVSGLILELEKLSEGKFAKDYLEDIPKMIQKSYRDRLRAFTSTLIEKANTDDSTEKD